MLVRFLGGTVDSGQMTPNVGAATLILVLVPLFFTVKSIKRAERIAFGADTGVPASWPWRSSRSTC